MSLVIPVTLLAGNKARASDVMANFQAVSAKFTEGAGGIVDADISSGAAIKGTKLSAVSGSRVTASQLEDDAVDSRVLKDDATTGAANAAVATAAHIKDGIITGDKLVDDTLKKGKLNLLSATVSIPSMAPGNTCNVTTGLSSSSAFPVVCVAESTTDSYAYWGLALESGTYYVRGGNAHGSPTSAAFTLRVWYLGV